MDKLDKLDEALVTIITKVTSGVEQAGAFILEETPLIIQQLITWNLILSAFMSIIALGIMVSSVFTIRYLFKPKYSEGDNNRHWTRDRQGREELSESAAFCTVFCIIGTIGGFISLIWHVKQVLFILVAPKVWLLEYCATLVK